MDPQTELRLGPVGVVDGGLAACQDCAYAMPAEARICPVCGFERVPYPAGRVERFDWVFSQRLAPNDKLVMLALVAHDGPGSKGVFPSIARLTDMTCLSRSTVLRALAHFGNRWFDCPRPNKARRATIRKPVQNTGCLCDTRSGCHTDTLNR